MNVCSSATCLYGAGTGSTGLSCAARCCCCYQAHIMKPASWYLDLLHSRLSGQGDYGLKLRAADGHGWNRFNILKKKRKENTFTTVVYSYLK